MDSDWAGCSVTRKSTTGVLIKVLGCTLHCISKTQQILALSSGEAELYAIGTGIAEGLALGNFAVEACICTTFKLVVYTDSTTGKSIAIRFGVTKKTRHIDLKFLYMQELVKQGIVELRKVAGTNNPADLMTKYVAAETLQRMVDQLGLFPSTNQSLINYVQRLATTMVGCVSTLCVIY